MHIPKIDYTIKMCLDHLTSSDSYGSEIESYLTRYLNIVIYSSFEEEVKNIIVQSIKERFDEVTIVNYMRNSLSKLCRSIKSSEIAGLLGYFSPEIKEKFTVLIKEGNIEIAFNNIVVNRHKIAHEEGINLTIQELVTTYHNAHPLLDAIKEVLATKVVVANNNNPMNK